MIKPEFFPKNYPKNPKNLPADGGGPGKAHRGRGFPKFLTTVGILV